MSNQSLRLRTDSNNMAANQSWRGAENPTTGLDNKPDISEPSPYQPLDHDIDCTRLLKIMPAKNEDDLIACDLIHVNFGKRPTFEALSYMWGESTAQATIVLNGAKFKVRQNLFDALHYLRRYDSDTLYWIDAVCINQDDIPERNRQLRMMRHIYRRASTVVVWLGNKYLDYQESEPDLCDLDDGASSSPTIQLSSTPDETKSEQTLVASVYEGTEQRKMAKDLCADGYWNRLWIVQEIVQARRIAVCFGNEKMKWDDFIDFVTLSNVANAGPLRLDTQRKERYSGRNTFRRLLEDHKDAVCKEPRDKVYGLVGLAFDAWGFPMDYEKSLFEVWSDVMEFMNRQGLLEESDILPHGALVKYLLMANDLNPLQQVRRAYVPEFKA
jgi:hypothetical protein